MTSDDIGLRPSNEDEDPSPNIERDVLEGILFHKKSMRWHTRRVVFDLEHEAIYIYKVDGEEDSISSEVKSRKKSPKRGTNISQMSNQVLDNNAKVVKRTDNWKMVDQQDDDSVFHVQVLNNIQSDVKPKIEKTYTFKCSRGGNEKALWLDSAFRIKRLSTEDKKKGFIQFNLVFPSHRTRNNNSVNDYVLHKQLHDKDRTDTAIKASQVIERISSSEIDKMTGNLDKKEYQVMPHHLYPHRWMNLDELQKEMLRNSRNFHDLRQPCGDEIGSLKVEVLSCHGLPKLDKFSKIDPVVYLVLGSYAFQTDIIHNANRPCWPRRSKRACILPVFHAYSQLYVGVFDYDGEKESDDLAGRVVIDICKLRPCTLYDITLPLRMSSYAYSKQERGVIRLRFSLNWKSSRDAVLSYLPMQKINKVVTLKCGDTKTFRNIVVTVHGKDLPGKFSSRALIATKREFKIYKIMFFFITKQELSNLIFWVYPTVSLLAFVGCMHSVYINTIALLPVYCMLLLSTLLIRNYRSDEVQTGSWNFKPPELTEIFLSLLMNKWYDDTHYITPLDVAENACCTAPVDHMEYPFSSYDDKNGIKSTFHDSCCEKGVLQEDDEADIDIDENDCHLFKENAKDANDSDCVDHSTNKSPIKGKKDRPKGMKNQDVKIHVPSGTTILEDIEEIRDDMHNASGGIFKNDIFIKSNDKNSLDTIKKEEKILNLVPYKNPMMRQKAKYLGPMVEGVQIGIMAYRTVFKIFMWNDRYLSFWALVGSLLMAGILFIFPWRIFFFIIGFIMLGPQNWVIRKLGLANISSTKASVGEKMESKIPVEENKEQHGKDEKLISSKLGSFISKTVFWNNNKKGKKDLKNEDIVYSVTVPYSPVPFHRFNDWPPIRSHSKAVPVTSLH